VLEEGHRRGAFAFEDPVSQVAHFVISSLEGAMLVARSYGTPSRFDAVARRLVADLAGSRIAGAARSPR
jgi:hypothetical protein